MPKVYRESRAAWIRAHRREIDGRIRRMHGAGAPITDRERAEWLDADPVLRAQERARAAGRVWTRDNPYREEA